MRIIRLLIACLLIASPIHAATYYMGGVGDDFANLQAAMAGMLAGDTLIVRAGTYTGAVNVIDRYHRPPDGTGTGDNPYTIIKAETDGEVTFDGENLRNMFSLQGTNDSNRAHHIQFEGIIWGRNDFEGNRASLVYVASCNYIKFLRCGAFDCHDGDDGHVFAVYNSSYVLIEDCYVWGQFDYPVIFGHYAEKSIARRVVARADRNLDVEEYINIHGFNSYGNRECEFQNCIMIDSDQVYRWGSGTQCYAYAWMIRYDDAGYQLEDVYYRGCISLNNQGGLSGSYVVDDVSAVSFIDCIHWDAMNGVRPRDGGVNFDHCTFGSLTGSGNAGCGIYFESTYRDDVTNSIITGITNSYGIYAGASRYCCLYNNLGNYSGTSDRTGDITDVNPLAASLLYLPRVESDSALSGVAEDSRDIGATVMYRIGVDGSLWGDPGYNTVTEVPLWPFPQESLIRAKFAAYTEGGVNGARGFCATGKQANGTDDITLTSYIWEYLGNQIPSDIYGTGSITSSTRSGVSSFGVSSH